MKPILLYSLMTIVLITGTLGTLITKAMNEERSQGHPFHHAYFQAAMVYLGQAICMTTYQIYSTFNPSIKSSFQITSPISGYDKLITKLGRFVYAIPTLFDLISCIMSYTGLIFVAPSIYQMLRGFIIVVVALYSVVFLHKKLYRHETVGCVFAIIGVVIVGTESIFHQAASASNPILGGTLILMAQLFIGGVFVIEELFFSKIKIDPLEAVGLEGVFGIGYFLLLLPMLYFIPCDLSFCINGRVEDSVLAFEQIGTNSVIAGLFVASILNTAVYNWSGVSTTKHASSLTRSTLQTAKTVLVWICSILMGLEVFLWVQLIGFIVIAFGTMVYNEVVVIPWLGMKESVMNKREEKERGEVGGEIEKGQKDPFFESSAVN